MAAAPATEPAGQSAALSTPGVGAAEGAYGSMPLSAAMCVAEAADVEAVSGSAADAAAPAAAPLAPQSTAEEDGAAVAAEASSPSIAQATEAAVGSEGSEAPKKKKKKKKKKKAPGGTEEAAEDGEGSEPQAEPPAGPGLVDDSAGQPAAQAEAAATVTVSAGQKQPAQEEEEQRMGEPCAFVVDSAADLAAAEAAEEAPSVPGETELGKEVAHSLLG